MSMKIDYSPYEEAPEYDYDGTLLTEEAQRLADEKNRVPVLPDLLDSDDIPF